MHKEPSPEQAVTAEIAADTAEPPINLMARMKAAIADLSARQILKLVLLGLALLVWYPIYSRLDPFSTWVAYDVFRIAPGTHLGDAVSFFFLDIPKVFMLLILVIFGVGILRSFFNPERTRTILAGKREILGDVLAALLGVVTPFCSCSAVPLFIGFVEAGIPIGVTFAFLISAPMVNEIALVLLFGLFGWRIALIYMSMGLLIAILTGIIIGRLNMERQVEDWVYEIRMGQTPTQLQELSWMGRVDYGLYQVKEIVGRVWFYIILGIGAGRRHPRLRSRRLYGVNHGQTGLVVGAGRGRYWGAALLQCRRHHPGGPGLAGKRRGPGHRVGLHDVRSSRISFPEIVILRKVLKPKLIAVFVGVVALGIISVGFLFNAIM